MAPIHQSNIEHANADDDDDESYIEEEIIEDDDEESVEEEIIDDDEIIEEEVVEDDDDEAEETVVEDDEGSISLGDDSSSAPDAQRPVEKDKKASKSEARSQLLQEIAAQRKLAEDLKRQNSKGDIKRNKALTELRRQAARDELARSNSKLKTGRVARSIASASTTSSFGDKKESVDRVRTPADMENINTVAIPPRQAPVSPLKSREDPPSQSTKRSSQIAKLKSKLKPAPFGHRRKNSNSGVTEWIREDPMEQESDSKGLISSEENVKTSEKMAKGNGTRTSVSQLKKQLSLGSAQSNGPTGSESGSIPLKSRSNDMSISSISESNLDFKVDNFYSLAQLQAKSVDGIDGARREKYLSPKDFEAHFNMTKEEFYKLPRWKQSEAKKALKLF